MKTCGRAGTRDLYTRWGNQSAVLLCTVVSACRVRKSRAWQKNLLKHKVTCIFSTSCESYRGYLFDMATKKKQKKTEDENHEFKFEWTEIFAFIQNLNDLPICLICQEKMARNKKSNLERHFATNHASFSIKYPVGDARRKHLRNFKTVKKNQLLY